MTNHVVNDRGETVLAIGAPGSLARFSIEHPDRIKQAHFFLFDNNNNNLIFKDRCAVGVLVCTSEGWCAEELTTDEWLWPDEYPGDAGIYDLSEILESNGYKVWIGHRYIDRVENLAMWLHEQD